MIRTTYTQEEIEATGLDDFRVFLRQVWDYLGLPPPTPVQNDMAYNLQHGPRRFTAHGDSSFRLSEEWGSRGSPSRSCAGISSSTPK
jgi:hypothetical protein